MNRLFDIAIIGAGPGGLVAAKECAAKGYSTVVIERKSKIGVPVHCGECISEFAFQNTGLKPPDNTIAKIVKGVALHFPNGDKKSLLEKGFILNKAVFQQWLGNLAKNQGAQLALNANVKAINYHRDQWSLSLTDSTAIKSRFLIDASGVNSIANKHLKFSRPFLRKTGIQYHAENIAFGDFIEFYLDSNAAPEGYLWKIPDGASQGKFGLVTQNPRNAKEALKKFFQGKHSATIKLGKKSGGFIPASGPLEQTHAERLLVIGDAAGFTNPLFEGGTHIALKSGLLAAQQVHEAFKKNQFGSKFLSNYQNQWQRQFPDYQTILKGRGIFYQFPEPVVKKLGDYIPPEIIEFPFAQKLKTALKILFTNPSLIKHGSYYAMKAFEYSRARYYGW